MLGCRLPAALVQTNDIDIAQFANVSVAIGDTTSPLLDVLRQADPGFRPVPHIVPDSVVSLMAGSGVRVDFLTPNRGRDSEVPVHLPALGVDAQPLRFLDFLITEPEPAVLLHGAGVLVSVPSPARFAVHKLILSRRRRPGDAKQRKDLMQAESLLRELAARDALGLQAIWHEAAGRGKTWNRLLVDGLAGIDQTVANSVRLCVGTR